MSNPNKVRGTSFETDLVKYLREQGLEADRLTLSGSADEGDVLLRVGDRRFVLEAKNRKQVNLAGWVGEAHSEATNYAIHRGMPIPHYAVVHKRKGKGVHLAYVTLPLHEYLGQIQ